MRLKSPATMQRYGTVLRCYDNGGLSGRSKRGSADRYTIVPPKHAHEYRCTVKNGWTHGTANRCLFTAIGSSADPYWAQGIGLVTTAMPGPHLGKRIKWDDLPKDVQTFARDVFPEYAPEPTLL
jgi:hypothetical protein